MQRYTKISMEGTRYKIFFKREAGKNFIKRYFQTTTFVAFKCYMQVI